MIIIRLSADDVSLFYVSSLTVLSGHDENNRSYRWLCVMNFAHIPRILSPVTHRLKPTRVPCYTSIPPARQNEKIKLPTQVESRACISHSCWSPPHIYAQTNKTPQPENAAYRRFEENEGPLHVCVVSVCLPPASTRFAFYKHPVLIGGT